VTFCRYGLDDVLIAEVDLVAVGDPERIAQDPGHDVALSAWELACHTFPTTVFAGQGLFVLSVDDCH